MQIPNKIFKRIKAIVLYFIGRINGLFSQRRYGIKKGYRHRKKYVYCDDTLLTDEYQKQVYELARFYLDKYGYKNVVDIGCGSAYKLIHYFSDCRTIGIDVTPTYNFLIKKYPDRIWVNTTQIDDIPTETDIVICADVIEHLLIPDELIEMIRKMKFELLFISTPERSMVRGWHDYGPPENECHVREWNAKEFRRYISPHFDILSHQITNVEDGTQLLICKKKSDIDYSSPIALGW